MRHVVRFLLALVTGFQQVPVTKGEISMSSGMTMNTGTDMGDMMMMMKTGSKSMVNFAHFGAQMQLCPSGDCTTGHQFMQLALKRLEEVDASGQRVINKVIDFDKTNCTWSTLASIETNGIKGSQSRCSALVKAVSGNNAVDSAAMVPFNLTASMFEANVSIAYGTNSAVFVPSGALKFTFELGAWPFASEGNRLQLAVALAARTLGGQSCSTPHKLPTSANVSTMNKMMVERMDLMEGMFLDSPSMALLDNVEVFGGVNSSVNGTELSWQFEHFAKSLSYDPVLGTDNSTGGSTTTTTTNGAGSACLSALGAALGALVLSSMSFLFRF